ncbi:DNA primase [Streptomyces ipomoeae]|uniref:DNA primase n=1 Tax=Streptomyces ipomoeae TaxID=103232 RepID=UPI0029A1CBD9|nr:DNA primase [Streptomyces ipomoeae]MDX2694495.1 DNA primase [Streptomyces ipomoeae]
MNRRLGLGLAIGAGYVLGRTKKTKPAFAVGTVVAGKRMRLSPRALADLVSHHLRNTPQVKEIKEIGDQLHEDLRGIGKTATAALLERRLESLATRLHDRTERIRDQLGPHTLEGRDSGRTPERSEEDAAEDSAPPAFEERGPGRSPRDGTGRGGGGEEPMADHDVPEDEWEQEPEPPRQKPAKKPAAKKSPAKKTAAKKTAAPAKKAARKTTATKATAKKDTGTKATGTKATATKATATKTSAKKTSAKKTSARKTVPTKAAAKTAARRTTRSRSPKEGGGDD